MSVVKQGSIEVRPINNQDELIGVQPIGEHEFMRKVLVGEAMKSFSNEACERDLQVRIRLPLTINLF